MEYIRSVSRTPPNIYNRVFFNKTANTCQLLSKNPSQICDRVLNRFLYANSCIIIDDFKLSNWTYYISKTNEIIPPFGMTGAPACLPGQVVPAHPRSIGFIRWNGLFPRRSSDSLFNLSNDAFNGWFNNFIGSFNPGNFILADPNFKNSPSTSFGLVFFLPLRPFPRPLLTACQSLS